MTKLAALALVLLPLVSVADEMVVDGTVIREGELAEILLELAGEPKAVRYERICLTNDCTEIGNLERWIYVRDGMEYTVGVYEGRVTSVRQTQPY